MLLRSIVQEIAYAFRSPAADVAEMTHRQALDEMARRLPELRERVRYARTVFDMTIGQHPATSLTFRAWDSALSSAARIKLYEAMRDQAAAHEHLLEVFRLRERAVGDLEMAEHVMGRAA